MTDLPRRSFPLVVPPPGGFEDAVRRGRRRRRKQTTGSSAAVVMLVGALTWSVAAHDGGGAANRLTPAENPRVTQSHPAPGGPATTTPPTRSPASENATAPRSGQAAGSPRPVMDGGGTGPTAVPTPGVSQPAPRPPGGRGVTVRPYAPRSEIARNEGQTLSCIPEQGEDWCAVAHGAELTDGTGYQLDYAICRAVTAGTVTLHFSRHEEADFVATDTDHNDPVWTYSKGQPLGTPAPDVTFGPGDCVMWVVVWDGHDDYGYMPVHANYTVTARLLSDEQMPAVTSDTFVHE